MYLLFCDENAGTVFFFFFFVCFLTFFFPQDLWAKTCVDVLKYPYMVKICGEKAAGEIKKGDEEERKYPTSVAVTPNDKDG